ncbi:hypothetical protein BU24DRAFT_80394 [Aaosphaeria arxii CBS 175.79]|uniref:Uncharacterized protein n=1 Tax=Aaosphaeria arxii CBS 175.79 TaxID=1450172 RepID=A0A6A5XA62_9PLEO|nr:uncharacterized protein BU24DRAFT_80394 [Aaosphaeria arxii CBS 175.79]KAF2009654.1 hypothetical protein BU24DRAFT_80394 [Aaosphaeria arxii CBS 175.79]
MNAQGPFGSGDKGKCRKGWRQKRCECGGESAKKGSQNCKFTVDTAKPWFRLEAMAAVAGRWSGVGGQLKISSATTGNWTKQKSNQGYLMVTGCTVREGPLFAHSALQLAAKQRDGTQHEYRNRAQQLYLGIRKQRTRWIPFYMGPLVRDGYASNSRGEPRGVRKWRATIKWFELR